MLDIACGSGKAVPRSIAVGADRSPGMLCHRAAKAREIRALRAGPAALPFAADSFDCVGCRFAFHHFRNKAEMLRETDRVRRLDGRFVLRKIGPITGSSRKA